MYTHKPKKLKRSQRKSTFFFVRKSAKVTCESVCIGEILFLKFKHLHTQNLSIEERERSRRKSAFLRAKVSCKIVKVKIPCKSDIHLTSNFFASEFFVFSLALKKMCESAIYQMCQQMINNTLFKTYNRPFETTKNVSLIIFG